MKKNPLATPKMVAKKRFPLKYQGIANRKARKFATYPKMWQYCYE